MYTKSKFPVFIAALVIFFSACKDSHKIIPVDPRFAKHISGYTSGMQSSTQPIRIELANSLDIPKNAGGLPDSNLLKDVFSFSPNIKGHAVWINDKTIEFIPEGKLDPETFYNATLY